MKLSRRHVLQSAAGAALAGALPARLGGTAPRRPNVLFILADDLGYADLSCYGRRDYATPELDRLAARGLRMTHGYANSPVCSPTRIALITGRYQYRLRAGLEEPIVRRDAAVGLPPAQPTLPSLFRAAGYRTALVGKWHMGWPPEHGPLRSGYQRFFGIYPGAADYFTHSGDGAAVPADTRLFDGETPVERHGYLTTLLADRACAEIAEAARAEESFLISLHFTAPHWPWQGPGDRDATRPRRDLFDREGGSLETYAEIMGELDRAVGRVLAELRRRGLEQDTIVVFTSDNGGERFSDTWPFRGEKTDLLEGGIRVPLIVRWPRAIRGGRTSDQVMASMDWLPTLAGAASLAPDPAAPPDGENLIDTLTGRAPVRERRIFWRYKSRDQAALRVDNLKYLRRGASETLYDVVADPRERANLRERRPDAFAALKRDWEAWNRDMLPYPEGSISAGE